MAAVAITGASWPGQITSRCGPFKDSSGNLWVIAQNATPRITAYKSSDGGASWGTSFQVATITPQAYDCVFDSANDVIYVAGTAGGTIQVYSFTISTTTAAEVFSSGTRPTASQNVNGEWPIFLTRLSTGAFRVFYQGSHTLMGSAFRAVFYAPLTSAGVWGASVEVSAGAKSHNDCKAAVLGASDRVHMFFDNATAGRHRSLSSASALDTAATVATTVAADYYNLFYDATLAKVVLGPIAGTVYRTTSGANPTWAADTNTVGSDVPASSNAAFAYDTTGSKLYVFYRDSSSADVFVNSAASTTWGTAATQDVTTAVAGISANPVTSALGIVFNDSGVYYDTFSLASGTTYTKAGYGIEHG